MSLGRRSGVKRHAASHTLALKATTPRDLLDADWITVARFDSLTTPGDIGSILAREVDDWNEAGVATVRLGTRTTDHPIYTTDRPHFILALEWLAQPIDGDALIAGLMRAIDASTSVSRQIIFQGQRLFPWPNVATVGG
ncbi:hypothetical protein AB4Z40_27350 [Bosea sp. 2YAB26]|uniref:hypothetical protein n=1 Tax=Bosea sp. 2YAB26 TaxID=3237478 RepID=UPI003F8F776C